jgi:hypothetical protein
MSYRGNLIMRPLSEPRTDKMNRQDSDILDHGRKPEMDGDGFGTEPNLNKSTIGEANGEAIGCSSRRRCHKSSYETTNQAGNLAAVKLA